MNVAWNNFTPYTALAGGMLIGVAVAIFVLFNGRITGISGILGGLLRPAEGNVAWRVLFLIGLLSAPLIYALVSPVPILHIDADWVALVIAGLLVGVGTRYGAGCTSGHGVCGIARLSPRSLVATVVFMTAGVVTVYALRQFIVV